MGKWTVFWVLMLMNLLWLTGCENSASSDLYAATAARLPARQAGVTPAEHGKGEALFNARCAPCHGTGAMGTDHGPPFLHKIYEPNHHGDPSFHRAVQQGVQAHHWKFGNMPKIEGLSEQDVNAIIGYVRWLQRLAGIF